MRAFSCILFSMVLSFSAYSQLNNSFFKQSREKHEKGSLDMYLEQMSFFRNTEYKSKADVGSTLFGYQLSPQVGYQIHPNIRMEGGIWLQKDFGNQDFTEVAPIVRFIYQKDEVRLIAGNLFGASDHNIVEPLFHPEYTITNRIEEGVQFTWLKERFELESWIDWQQMIYQGSPFREEFLFGFHAEPWLIKNEALHISFPTQVLILHKGGEIDLSGEGVLTQLNFSYGLNTKVRLRQNLDLNIHGSLNYFEDPSTEPEYFIDGLGQLVLVTLDWEKLGIGLQYWDGHEFHGSTGDPIYQSMSRLNPSLYTYHYRKMASLRAYYQVELVDNLAFLFRGHALYDLNQPNFNFVGELYLRWNPNFKLGSINHKK
jgi:hypothetical protein